MIESNTHTHNFHLQIILATCGGCSRHAITSVGPLASRPTWHRYRGSNNNNNNNNNNDFYTFGHSVGYLPCLTTAGGYRDRTSLTTFSTC